jgi:ATP-dependent DNA helicase RecG
MGVRSTARVELSGRGLAEELRAVLDAFSSSNRTISLPVAGLAEGAVGTLPFGAVREALVNAVMHRDWDRSGPIVIDHAEAELAVYSPGPFLEGVSEHTVLTAPSRTRNPHLGSVLRSLRIAEREGTGVDRMFIEMIRLGHGPPTFTERDAGVRVTLRGGAPVPEVLRVHAPLPPSLRRSARSAVVIDLLRKRPSISAAELAEAAQEVPEELTGFLDEAVAAGLLQRTANPRRGGVPAWRLADANRERLGSVLPYYVRPGEESVRLIGQFAQSQGEVRNQDVQDLLGLTSARASQLLKRAETDGVIRLGPTAKPMGRGTFYVPVS